MFTLEHSSSVADIATALANSVSSMLGSPFKNKWIITEDEPTLCRDVLVFLQNVDIEHPIGQLICTCCEEYHRSFGCGTKTVLYLIGQWINLCCSLKFQGIPISKILFLLKQSLSDCITFLDHLVIPTEEFLADSKGTQSRKNEMFNSRSLLLTSDDPRNNDILARDKKNSQDENLSLDFEDEDISWFLSETDQKTLPMAALNHSLSDASLHGNKKASCKNPEYSNNNALIPPIDSIKSTPSFDSDEDFDCCFDYLNADDASRCEKIVQVSPKEPNSETRTSNSPSSVLSFTSTSGKPFKMDNFLEYLDSKCQQYQNQALSNTVWSSRHLSSLASEDKSLDFTEHQDRDILKPCFMGNSRIETKRKNIQTVQQKISKDSQTIDSFLEHSRKLNSNAGIKSSGTEAMWKYLSDIRTENSCVTPQISEKEISRDNFSVPEGNIKEFHINEFSENLMQSSDSKTKDFCNSQDVLGEIPSQCLESLVHGLCHGSNEYIEDFLIEALRHQHRSKTRKNKSLGLRMNMLHLCCIQGPCLGSSRFVPGVVLSVREEKLHFWDLTKMQNHSHKVLNVVLREEVKIKKDGMTSFQNSLQLVKTDVVRVKIIAYSMFCLYLNDLVKTSVTHNTHHVGYQKLAKVENTWTKEKFILSGETSAKDKWISQVQWILKKLKVTVLVAIGKVDKDLEQVLSCNGILVFENTEQSAVEALATLHENARTEPVVYITDATQKNILAGLLMEPLNEERILTSNQHPRKFHFVLSTPQSQVQTLVLHHPAKAGLDLLAQEFWLCSHRVASALSHGKVLPGRGRTEQKCADYLLNKIDLLKQSYPNSNGLELYQAEIILKLAESFQSFAKSVSLNSGSSEMDIGHLILDDHFTKIQAWKTVLQLVSIISRIDTQIVLGTPQ